MSFGAGTASTLPRRSARLSAGCEMRRTRRSVSTSRTSPRLPATPCRGPRGLSGIQLARMHNLIIGQRLPISERDMAERVDGEVILDAARAIRPYLADLV